jgi:hypothetical protein
MRLGPITIVSTKHYRLLRDAENASLAREKLAHQAAHAAIQKHRLLQAEVTR